MSGSNVSAFLLPVPLPNPVHALTVWDAATGRRLRDFLPGSMVQSVAFSPDGNLLAAGTFGLTWRNKLKVWDLRTGRPLHFPPHRTQVVGLVAFSPNGNQLAVSDDNGVSVIDVSNRTEHWLVRGQRASFEFSFAPDGRLLATTHPDGSIRLWDISTWKVEMTITAPSGAGMPVFSPHGKTLAALCADGAVRLWDVGSGKDLRSFVPHQKWVGSLAFLADGKTLASASLDGTLEKWNIDTGEDIGKFSLISK
ncbi:MAG: hypothetical protein LAP13_05710 [Acidobacteriia bacterium]|nr:hypothetical protein [Terriglobia bacterium]